MEALVHIDADRVGGVPEHVARREAVVLVPGPLTVKEQVAALGKNVVGDEHIRAVGRDPAAEPVNAHGTRLRVGASARGPVEVVHRQGIDDPATEHETARAAPGERRGGGGTAKCVAWMRAVGRA